jgi:hypothetical protein
MSQQCDLLWPTIYVLVYFCTLNRALSGIKFTHAFRAFQDLHLPRYCISPTVAETSTDAGPAFLTFNLFFQFSQLLVKFYSFTFTVYMYVTMM